MMIATDSYFLYLLLTSNALLLAIACVTVARFERRCKRIEEFWDSPTGAALNEACDEEADLQVKATQRLEQRVGELQRVIKVMDMKVPEQPAPLESKLPIENAVRMARLGASIDDLTRNCGLNVGEAQLMKRLHGKAQEAACQP